MATTDAANIHATTSSKNRIVLVTSFLGRFPLSILQLLFRLAVASVFLKAGFTKIASWQLTLQLFIDEYKVPVVPPEIAAMLATMFELGCSTLLIVGLFTRLATLPLLGMIITIQLFVYPNAYSEHLVWGSILIFLLMYGAGTYSLDRLIGIERSGLVLHE
jgi:putative oxidoreductase